jgi:hypothetical protein
MADWSTTSAVQESSFGPFLLAPQSHLGPEAPARGGDVEQGKLTRRSFLLAGASALVAGSAWGRVNEDRSIILGQVSLSFYAVTGAVVHEVLERLGHSVEVWQGPHEQMFPLLGQGAIDLMAAAWLPEGHAAYWARHGAGAEEVARLYDGARFFWAVPDYVPESEVTSIADLAKPSVAQRMTKLIQGIGTGRHHHHGFAEGGRRVRARRPRLFPSSGNAGRMDRRLRGRGRRAAMDRLPDLGAAIPQPRRQAAAPSGSARRSWRRQPRLARRAS